MVLTAPTILQPQVRISSKPSMLSTFYIVEIETVIVAGMRKGQNKWKRGRDCPILKNRFLKEINYFKEKVSFSSQSGCKCLILTSSVTKWQDYLLNIWPSAKIKFCPIVLKFCQSGLKYQITPLKMAKVFLKFAKVG